MISDSLLRAPQAKFVNSGGILSVVLVYAVFAALWILLSDKVVQIIFSDPGQIILASMLKGWLFVGVTSMLLYGLMRRWVAAGVVDSKASPDTSYWFSVPFLSLVLIILIFTGASVFNTFVQHKETEIARLQAIADLKTQQIADWLKERQSDADFVQSSDFFAEQYRNWQDSGDLQSGVRLQTRLEQFCKNRGITAVTILSPGGEKLWESNKALLTVYPNLYIAADLAKANRKVRRADPYRDTTGNLRLDFIVPLTAGPGPAPLVVLHADLANWLFPTLQTWPTPSASGETLLFRRDGNQVFYLNDLRDRKGSALNLSLPLTTKKLLAAQVLRGEVTLGKLVEGVDYQGTAVIGIVQAIAGTDWLLIAKLDQSELYGEIAGDIAWIGFAGLVTLLMSVAGFYLLRQGQQLVLAKAVQQSQEERLSALHLLSALADSSDDAIFAKDLDGRFILFNRAASQFVGKPVEDILGNDDHIIFPAEQAEKLIAVGRQVIAENRILTQEEVLDMPNGKRIFLATKGPLRDASGNIMGIFGISRDITEMKEVEQSLRKSEERLRLALDATDAGLWDWDLRTGVIYRTSHYFQLTGYRPDEATADFDFFRRLAHPDDLPNVLETIAAYTEGKTTSIEFDYRLITRSGKIKWVGVKGRAVERDANGKSLRIVGTITDISARKLVEQTLRGQTEELTQRNEELERFNRVTIGRELDMIALKQQVNELLRELGREPSYPLTFLDAPLTHDQEKHE